MKSQKLVDELNKQFDSAIREREDRKNTLKCFFQQFRSEEKKLLKKLKKESHDAKRKKLKRKLGKVQKAYEIMSFA